MVVGMAILYRVLYVFHQEGVQKMTITLIAMFWMMEIAVMTSTA